MQNIVIGNESTTRTIQQDRNDRLIEVGTNGEALQLGIWLLRLLLRSGWLRLLLHWLRRLLHWRRLLHGLLHRHRQLLRHLRLLLHGLLQGLLTLLVLSDHLLQLLVVVKGARRRPHAAVRVAVHGGSLLQ